MQIFKISLVLLLLLFSRLSFSQHAKPEPKGPEIKTVKGRDVNWVDFNQGIQLYGKEQKKMLIDVYTAWCGWCKHMDKLTYKDSSVIDYINANYIAVKLDAETRDTFALVVQDQNGKKEIKKFAFKPDLKANELAFSLLNGNMGYPTTVFLDEKLNMIQPMAGYIDAVKMHKVLVYYSENYYRNGVKFEDFEKDVYKGK